MRVARGGAGVEAQKHLDSAPLLRALYAHPITSSHPGALPQNRHHNEKVHSVRLCEQLGVL